MLLAVALRRRELAQAGGAGQAGGGKRKRSRRRGKHDVRSTQERAEDEDARHRRLNVEAAARLTEIGRLSRVDKAPRLWRLWRLWSVWRAMVEVLALERALGEGSMDRGLLDAAREDSKTIAVEYCWTGATPVDVQLHSPIEGPAEAGTFLKIISVPCCAPAFSFGGLRLWWAIFPCESASVGAGDVVEATEPEPELEDAQEAAVVAQHQRLAAMEAQESGAGSPPAPVQCVVRLIVGFPGYQGGQGFGARGFPFASLIKTGVLVWDRSSLGEELRREWLSCQGVVDAQLDAYAGGSGEWATGADDDDDYEDECVAETWRDGGVLSEADA